MEQDKRKGENKPSLWQIITSVLAAFLGVQNDKNRERDFAGGDIKAYIVVGVIATVFLVLGLVSIVNIVLA